MGKVKSELPWTIISLIINTNKTKKRICFKDRLKTHDPATIKSITEGRMNVERYLERKAAKLQVDGIL